MILFTLKEIPPRNANTNSIHEMLFFLKNDILYSKAAPLIIIKTCNIFCTLLQLQKNCVGKYTQFKYIVVS